MTISSTIRLPQINAKENREMLSKLLFEDTEDFWLLDIGLLDDSSPRYVCSAGFRNRRYQECVAVTAKGKQHLVLGILRSTDVHRGNFTALFEFQPYAEPLPAKGQSEFAEVTAVARQLLKTLQKAKGRQPGQIVVF